MKAMILNHTLPVHSGLSLCLSAWVAPLAVLLGHVSCYCRFSIWDILSSLVRNADVGAIRCAKACCVAFHSWVHYMSCFCSPSTCDLVSNNWNTVGTSGVARVVQLLSLIGTFHKSKRVVVRFWRDPQNSWVCLTLQRLKQRYSSSVYHGCEIYFCQTTSLYVLTSSHELLPWSQAILWKEQGFLSVVDDLA